MSESKVTVSESSSVLHPEVFHAPVLVEHRPSKNQSEDEPMRNSYFALVVNLKYRKITLTYDRNVIAEILSCAVHDLYDAIPVGSSVEIGFVTGRALFESV